MAHAPTHPNMARKRELSRAAVVEAEQLGKQRHHAAVVAAAALAAQRARTAKPARKGPARDSRGRFVSKAEASQ